MTREAWLQAGSAALAEWISQKAGATVPEHYVSVGFPKGSRGRRQVGQCWKGALSTDGKPHLFVCPTQSDATRVLDILLHELIHATVGTDCGHKGAFVAMARSCGLLKPWTATTAGDALEAFLKPLAERLGAYPHSALNPNTIRKPGSRLRLWECSCGVKVRVARDEFQAVCQLCECAFKQSEVQS